MSPKKSLDLDTLLAESAPMGGAIGALAYTVLKGLEAGGADDSVISGVRVLIQEHFQRLTDDDCNVLCDLLFRRLNDEAKLAKEEARRWYTGQ